MDCPRCKSNHYVKDGIVRSLQRFRCKDCHYRYTVKFKSGAKTPETKRLALELYLEGLDFRSIGRILNVSYGTVYAWVRKWGSQASLPRREMPVKIEDLDKMFTYLASKKDHPSHKLLLIDLEKNISVLSVDTLSQRAL